MDPSRPVGTGSVTCRVPYNPRKSVVALPSLMPLSLLSHFFLFVSPVPAPPPSLFSPSPPPLTVLHIPQQPPPFLLFLALPLSVCCRLHNIPIMLRILLSKSPLSRPLLFEHLPRSVSLLLGRTYPVPLPLNLRPPPRPRHLPPLAAPPTRISCSRAPSARREAVAIRLPSTEASPLASLPPTPFPSRPP